MNIQFAMQSVVGLRTNNEDAMLALDLGNSCYYFAVADGMGGAVAGEIASNLVLKKIREYLLEAAREGFKDKGLKELMRKTILIAQNAISERIEDHPVLKGMGTTLVALLICQNKFVWVNIGDSRIFRLNNSHLSQITTDHTYLNDFLKEQEKPVTLSDTFIEQYGHLITRVINGGTDMADIYPAHKDYKMLCDGDMFLLCSDGLITKDIFKNIQIIKNLVNETDELNSTISRLIERAGNNGSKDNITAILVKVGMNHRQSDYKTLKLPAFTPKKNRLFSTILWSVLISLSILILLYSFTKIFH